MASKGRVTIPFAVRAKAGLLPNTEVEIDYDREYVRVRRARRRKKRSRGEELLKRVRDRSDVPMTTEEIMALLCRE